MKTLVIYDLESENPFIKSINRVLNNTECGTTLFDLTNHEIEGCIGCFSCFFKTPGICIFDDAGRKIPNLYVDSDIVIFISPVTFGGYSSRFSKMFNRVVIQLESHLLASRNGSMYRKKRYNAKYPSLMVIGVDNDADSKGKEIFKNLVSHNAVEHLHSSFHKTLFITENMGVDEFENNFKNTIEEIRSQ